MRKIMTKSLIAAALLVLAIPIAASAQFYDRNRYDRFDRHDVRDAISRLDNSSARLENELNFTRGRRVFGFFWVRNTDPAAVAEVRDFRLAVRALRNSSNNGRALYRSTEEARLVLDRGVQLDRDLRLRTGRTDVDADLSEIRSNLHIIADAYGLSMPY
jgi:hypothetical protein